MDFMKGAGMVVGGIVIGSIVVIIGIFLFAIFGALIGAITGWILGQTPILGDAVRAGFTSVFGVESPDLVAIGAMLGFIAGFFKSWDHKAGEKQKDECDEKKFKEWAKEIPDVHIDIKPRTKGKKK